MLRVGHSCLHTGAKAAAKQADLTMLSMRRRRQLAEAVAAARSARSRRSSKRRVLMPAPIVHHDSVARLTVEGMLGCGVCPLM